MRRFYRDGSFGHPKQIFRLMGQKIFTIYAQKFCFSGSMYLKSVNEQVHEIRYLQVTSAGSDGPVHLCSFIKAFAAPTHKV